MASFSHYPNETKCWDWIEIDKEDLKKPKSFQALRSAARVNHLVVMILEFGMTLCDVAGSSSGRSETAALCISSNKV